MTPNRQRIVAAFESLKKLLCDIGWFVVGDAEAGVFVRYWGNQHIRELKTYRHGVQEGLEVRRYGPSNPPHFSHYKDGKPYGEATGYYNSGRVLEHFLIDGENKTPFSRGKATEFQGYVTTEEDEELYRKYARYPVREVFM